jgi:predicted Zn-ribbon and HTH transcriptional regulator
MKNLTPELIAKAKAAKSAEELLALAKENNVELTEEEAKTYFEQLNANGTVSDDELNAVAGGGDCFGSDDEEEEKEMVVTSMKCPKCGAKFPDRQVQHFKCPQCNTSIFHPASMPNKGVY